MDFKEFIKKPIKFIEVLDVDNGWIIEEISCPNTSQVEFYLNRLKNYYLINRIERNGDTLNVYVHTINN